MWSFSSPELDFHEDRISIFLLFVCITDDHCIIADVWDTISRHEHCMIHKSKNSNTIHLEGNAQVASTCMAAIILHDKYDSHIKYS